MIPKAPLKQPHQEEGRDGVSRVTTPWWGWYNAVEKEVRALQDEVGGSVVTITDADSPYTVPSAVKLLRCDTDSGVIAVTFPAGTSRKQLRVTNIGTSGNDVTMNGNGTETIDGLTSQTLYDKETYNSYYDSINGWW